MVNPCPRIYIPTNVYTSICFIFINEIELATNEVMSPQTRKFLATHKHWPLKVQPFHSLSLILSYSPSNPVHGGTFSTLYCFPKFLITFHLTYIKHEKVFISATWYLCYRFDIHVLNLGQRCKIEEGNRDLKFS